MEAVVKLLLAKDTRSCSLKFENYTKIHHRNVDVAAHRKCWIFLLPVAHQRALQRGNCRLCQRGGWP